MGRTKHILDGNHDIFGYMAISSLLRAIMYSQIANMPLKHQYVDSRTRFMCTYVSATYLFLFDGVANSIDHNNY